MPFFHKENDIMNFLETWRTWTCIDSAEVALRENISIEIDNRSAGIYLITADTFLIRAPYYWNLKMLSYIVHSIYE